VITYDQTLGTSGLLDFPIGIHGEFYPQYNRVLFTILNRNNGVTDNNTIGYNQILQAFETMYSATPGLYIRTSNRLLTSDTANPAQGYSIFKGNWGEIFGNYVESSITLLNNGEKPYDIKTYNNLILYTEVYNAADVNQPLETITSVQVTNDYQDTGKINLTPTTASLNLNYANIVRQERKWHVTIAEDQIASANSTQPARMRDFYALIQLNYLNNNNKRFILHDVLTKYVKSDA
jgi:hypothetical protein